MSTIVNILVVDDKPRHCELMKELLPSLVDNIEIIVADNPEDATKIIESRINLFPIIWSDYNFNNSKFNGLEFLEVASKISPLSSRLLCSAQFREDEMIEMVKNGAIQTHVSKPLIAKPTACAIKIGIEYHKVNVWGEFIDLTNFSSEDQLETNAERFEEINGIFDGESQLDTKSHEAELNNYLAHLGTTIKKFPIQIARQSLLLEELKEQKGKAELINKCRVFQYKISLLEEYLSKSKILVQNHFDVVSKIWASTSERDKQIQRLRDEFMDE